ncbi:MAG: hypothetical protein ACW99G_01785 [Candidatus Thorarchaeota archaeon]|jgi:hypothetical protein
MRKLWLSVAECFISLIGAAILWIMMVYAPNVLTTIVTFAFSVYVVDLYCKEKKGVNYAKKRSDKG